MWLLIFVYLLEHNNPLLYISDCGKKVLLLSGSRQVFLWETQESNEALNTTSGMCCIYCKKKLCKKWIFLYYVSFSSKTNFKKDCVILSNYLKIVIGPFFQWVSLYFFACDQQLVILWRALGIRFSVEITFYQMKETKRQQLMECSLLTQ